MPAPALPWSVRLAFGAGDLAQNFVFQVICFYLLFFYTDVCGLAPASAALLFLAVRGIDIVWTPLAGAAVERFPLRGGRYRPYVLWGGLGLCLASVMCFWNPFAGRMPLGYAFATYLLMSLIYTLVNVPYGALNASLSRDTRETTVLTTVRMVMANLGGVAVTFGVPLIAGWAAARVPGNAAADGPLPRSPMAWLLTMALFAAVGAGLLAWCFFGCRERVETLPAPRPAGLGAVWAELRANGLLRVLSGLFAVAFAFIGLVTAMGSYFVSGRLGGTAENLAMLNGAWAVAAVTGIPLVPWLRRLGKRRVMAAAWGVAAAASLAVFAAARADALGFPFLLGAQFARALGMNVAGGMLWSLIPDVITFGEYRNGTRASGIVNAIINSFFKTGLLVAGALPGAVLGAAGYVPGAAVQPALAVLGMDALFGLLPAGLACLAGVLSLLYRQSDASLERMQAHIIRRTQAFPRPPRGSGE